MSFFLSCLRVSPPSCVKLFTRDGIISLPFYPRAMDQVFLQSCYKSNYVLTYRLDLHRYSSFIGPLSVSQSIVDSILTTGISGIFSLGNCLMRIIVKRGKVVKSRYYKIQSTRSDNNRTILYLFKRLQSISHLVSLQTDPPK